jgi:hypothetical protein
MTSQMLYFASLVLGNRGLTFCQAFVGMIPTVNFHKSAILRTVLTLHLGLPGNNQDAGRNKLHY